MDAADDLRQDLFDNLAEQGELPKPPTKSAKTAPNLAAAVDPFDKDADLLTALPDGTQLSPDDIAILKRMNLDYCHTLVGGKNLVIGQRYCQVQGNVLTFEAPAEFKKKFHACAVNRHERRPRPRQTQESGPGVAGMAG
ncbi:hypothetical protein [Methylomonas koyamae]|uniref:Uncharacterized protein n=1 Tax=Methylomonas koyamae TaxID=702114 RepID=A0AA91D9R3_9GAMM|nr:hypothetical protein [Methylomonas koyamae]OAI22779.1 hypothetical protein A1356_18770 [Methylomonas koyamae]